MNGEYDVLLIVHLHMFIYRKTKCCPSWDNSQLKRTLSTNCCIHTVYLLMMGCRYARNM